MFHKLTKGGLTLAIIGGLIGIVGLALCLDALGPPPFGSVRSYQTGVLGIVLATIGGYLFKIGLGLTLVGHSERIATWLNRRWARWSGKDAGVECPVCHRVLIGQPNYCSNCGTKLTKE